MEGTEYTARTHWEQKARQGNAEAQAMLDGPPFPWAVDYLYRWLLELFGRSGVGMDGVAPLSYTTIEAWARLTGRTVAPHDVHGLMALDGVLRHPDGGDEEE